MQIFDLVARDRKEFLGLLCMLGGMNFSKFDESVEITLKKTVLVIKRGTLERVYMFSYINSSLQKSQSISRG